MALRVRELYELRFGLPQEAAFNAAAATMRAGRRLMPKPLARGYNTRSFKVLAHTEKRRIERGEPTPQIRAA